MTNRRQIQRDSFRTPAGGGLSASPSPEMWDHWEEADPRDALGAEKRRYSIVPTVCFNCESACGLLAYVDKDTREIRKLEGHPLHLGSRGRNCPKGPATLNQINNPDRILRTLKRAGPRSKGGWEEVSWDEALDDIAGRIREAIQADRRDSVVYQVGRAGEDLFTERVLAAWGVDGHNSHTNVCSAAARTGYAFWMGMDRPNPDHENARFMLLMSSHLESGHYFTPHAQRIIESKLKGGKVCVLDTRLSNTASQADAWLSPWPGTEPGLLLALANYLIHRDLINKDFLRRWTNWEELLNDTSYLAELRASGRIQEIPRGREFEDFRIAA